MGKESSRQSLSTNYIKLTRSALVLTVKISSYISTTFSFSGFLEAEDFRSSPPFFSVWAMLDSLKRSGDQGEKKKKRKKLKNLELSSRDTKPASAMKDIFTTLINSHKLEAEALINILDKKSDQKSHPFLKPISKKGAEVHPQADTE